MNIMLTYRTIDDVVIWLLFTYYQAQGMILQCQQPLYLSDFHTTHTTTHMHTWYCIHWKFKTVTVSWTMHATVEDFYMTTYDSLTTKIICLVVCHNTIMAYSPYWRVVSVKANYQVDVSYVETFLSNTCCHKSVVASITKLCHHLDNIIQLTPMPLILTCWI